MNIYDPIGSALGFEQDPELYITISKQHKEMLPLSQRVPGYLGFAGYTHTEETKALMSEMNKKRYESEEHRLKMSQAISKSHSTPEALKRHSEISKAYWTEENRKKRSQNMLGKRTGADNPGSIKVMCTKTGKVYQTLRECALEHNVDPTTIGRWCKAEKNNLRFAE